MNSAGLAPGAERAIKIFRTQISKLTGLCQSNSRDPDFVRWRTMTTEVFKRYLPQSDYYSTFKAIRFDPPVPAAYIGQSEVASAFARTCDEARACLEGAVEHIYMFGLNESETVKEVEFVETHDQPISTEPGVDTAVPANSRVLVLISHSAKDRLLAEALINLLRAGLGLLASEIRCTSVDGYRLPAGVNTNEQLRREINAVKVLIGLLTPSSISSTYVLFELGARWGAGLFMIPLLAGIMPEEMRGPHNVLNALSCDTDAQLLQLVDDIGTQLERPPGPPASYLTHARAVVESAKSVTSTMQPTSSASPAASATTMQRDHLADLISELEDNLSRARAPRIGDAFARPSTEVWRRVRNKVSLPDRLRSSLSDAYGEIDGWLTVVESGIHPNLGSPALNVATTSLRTRLPDLIEQLKKLL